MILKGIDFGPVWQGSGVTNFYGDGYWFHIPYRLLFPLRYRWTGTTFVAKTTTLMGRVGNLPLNKKFQPVEWFPDCIKVFFRIPAVGNAVALSGPGLKAVLDLKRWQAIIEPFMISFMPVADTPEGRIAEAEGFVAVLKPRLGEFKAPIGLQYNPSCPNLGHKVNRLGPETEEMITVLAKLGLPIIAKINCLVPFEDCARLEKHPHCDAIISSNTLHWESIPINTRWEHFGTKVSPLAKYGGGGWTGPFLFPLVIDWLKQARAIGFKKPICIGGGIFSERDVSDAFFAGADAISIASIAMVRPHRLQAVIKKAHSLFKDRQTFGVGQIIPTR
jgi:dihydroorotate dehydrogenase